MSVQHHVGVVRGGFLGNMVLSHPLDREAVVGTVFLLRLETSMCCARAKCALLPGGLITVDSSKCDDYDCLHKIGLETLHVFL